MNILIVGNGWVGTKVFHELVRRGGHTVNICSHKNVFSVVKNDFVFDWIINCAGITGSPNVDACELIKKETIEANAIFPVLLYRLCEVRGIRLAHFSSGCIYQGIIEDVDADPNFFGSIYSVSKGVSDSYLKDKAQVYRIRMPFTNIPEPKNLLSKLMKYAVNGKLIEGGPNSLTNLDEAIVVACNLIERNAPNAPYNLVNSGAVTMHEIVQLLNINPMWYTAEEFIQNTSAQRSNCVIPAYHEMSSILPSLKAAISNFQKS